MSICSSLVIHWEWMNNTKTVVSLETMAEQWQRQRSAGCSRRLRSGRTSIANGTDRQSSTQTPPGRTSLDLIENCHGRRMLRMDPVSFSLLDVPQVDQIHSVVHDRTAYRWSDADWMSKRASTDPLRSPLSIDEIQSKSLNTLTEPSVASKWTIYSLLNTTTLCVMISSL